MDALLSRRQQSRLGLAEAIPVLLEAKPEALRHAVAVAGDVEDVAPFPVAVRGYSKRLRDKLVVASHNGPHFVRCPGVEGPFDTFRIRIFGAIETTFRARHPAQDVVDGAGAAGAVAVLPRGLEGVQV